MTHPNKTPYKATAKGISKADATGWMVQRRNLYAVLNRQPSDAQLLVFIVQSQMVPQGLGLKHLQGLLQCS